MTPPVNPRNMTPPVHLLPQHTLLHGRCTPTFDCRPKPKLSSTRQASLLCVAAVPAGCCCGLVAQSTVKAQSGTQLTSPTSICRRYEWHRLDRLTTGLVLRSGQRKSRSQEDTTRCRHSSSRVRARAREGRLRTNGGGGGMF
ncbi:unnamed protein product [Ectocarpus sp. 12 AP-2014]